MCDSDKKSFQLGQMSEDTYMSFAAVMEEDSDTDMRAMLQHVS